MVATVSLPSGSHPEDVTYDAAKGEIFVSNEYTNSVSVISDSTNTIVGSISVGSLAYGIACDPVKSLVFVTNAYSNTVSIISALVAPSLASSPPAVDQGQTSTLTATMTTGAGPYIYQWFEKSPTGNYVAVGSNSATFNFATTGSTAQGNWASWFKQPTTQAQQ